MTRTIKHFLLAVILLAPALNCHSFEPTTTWPYLYEEFVSGRVVTYQAGIVEYDRLNVNVISGRVHYIGTEGKIMELMPSGVAGLTIGEDTYICAGGRMLRVLRKTSVSAVAESFSVDTDAMNKSDIGYGKSSLASTQNMSMAALSTEMDFSLNRSLDEVRRDRESGERLAMKRVPGIVYKGVFVPASRPEVLGIPGIDKDKVKAFLKANNIKFKNADDLAALLDFLYSF